MAHLLYLCPDLRSDDCKVIKASVALVLLLSVASLATLRSRAWRLVWWTSQHRAKLRCPLLLYQLWRLLPLSLAGNCVVAAARRVVAQRGGAEEREGLLVLLELLHPKELVVVMLLEMVELCAPLTV